MLKEHVEDEIIYVFQNNFWEGFKEETDSLKYSFFLDLLSKVFDKPVDKTDDPNKAQVLLESIRGNGINSYVNYKPWKYKILFSGESRLCPQYEYYDCILWGRKTEGKIVCCPFFLPYMISSGVDKQIYTMEEKAKHGETGRKIPRFEKILAIISNPNSTPRNFFLNILEKYFLVDYAGMYRTNRPVIQAKYFEPDFWKEISQYKCVLCMENSRDTDYLTEKITHGMCAGTVPIYWGATAVEEYFNPGRFVHVKELDQENITRALKKIHLIMKSDSYYREIVNEPIFANDTNGPDFVQKHMDRIVKEMRTLLKIEI